MSPPKIVVPVSACTDRVRLQGQNTGAEVTVTANRVGAEEVLFQGIASWPDEVFQLSRRLRADEIVTATQAMPGTPPVGVASEPVQPEPHASEVGSVTIDSHLHTYGTCGAIGNGIPGAEILVESLDRGGLNGRTTLGTGILDAESGAARIGFAAYLLLNERLVASQSICGIAGPKSMLPPPDEPAHTAMDDEELATPTIGQPLLACERAVHVGGVQQGATVRLTRQLGDEVTEHASCFDYPGLWFRLDPPLREGETVKVDQRYIEPDYESRLSGDVLVGSASAVPKPTIVPPVCEGATSIRLSGLRFGATVQILQVNPAGDRVIAHAEAWDETCDIPLDSGIQVKNGAFVSARQALCNLSSGLSDNAEVNPAHAAPPRPKVEGPLYECGRMVRVSGAHPGARIELYMTTVPDIATPAITRLIASQPVYNTTVDLLVSPALHASTPTGVFARQIGCGATVESEPEPVRTLPALEPPQLDQCGLTGLLVTGVVPGALVEVYRENSLFASTRSSVDFVYIWDQRLLDPPVGVMRARQILCTRVSELGPSLAPSTAAANRIGVVPRGKHRGIGYAAEPVAQLTGSSALPSPNNAEAAFITGTDLGIPIEHDADGRLYLLFGDTNFIAPFFVEDGKVVSLSNSMDVITRTFANTHTALLAQEPLDFGPPRLFSIPGVSQDGLEVPSGGFSHAGRLYVFATTGKYSDTPRTIGLGKIGDYMGRSLLVSATDWRENFTVVPGHEQISDRSREATGGLKFINIAPWKVKNSALRWLPANAAAGGEGLIMLGAGRYQESQPYLAYVPLPPGGHPVFSEWRYLSGTGGPCGPPLWSAAQSDAVPLWDDSRHFLPGAGKPPVPQNAGVIGEISLAYIKQLRLWLCLYGGGFRIVARTAPTPWGPWSEPIHIFDRGRDHTEPDDPDDPRPRFMPDTGWAVYGGYIIARFTESHPGGEATIYFSMSTWMPYQAFLMRTRVVLVR